MFRGIIALVAGLALMAACSGCAENEYKVTDKQETQTESQPRDTSPGTMVVE